MAAIGGGALLCVVVLAELLRPPHPDPSRPDLCCSPPPSDMCCLAPKRDLAATIPGDMVLFQGGTFTMRQRHVTLTPFAIDRFEVTNKEFVEWLNQSKGIDFDAERREVRTSDESNVLIARLQATPLKGPKPFSLVEGQQRRPMVYVSYAGAERYCREHGKRLPSTEEWVLAARQGTNVDQIYPWGDARPECAGVVFGRMKKTGPWSECLASSEWGPADVGSSPQDRTPQGVSDLGGNVTEWVEDADAKQKGLRAYLGGDWARTRDFLQIRMPDTANPDTTFPTLGFRCVWPSLEERNP